MKTHILLYSDDPGEGGLAQYEHSLACRLSNLGYEVSSAHGKSLDPGMNPRLAQEQQLGIQQISLGFTSGTDLSRTLKDIDSATAIFQQTRPDLILFSDGWPFSNFAAKQAAVRLGIPYLIVLGFLHANYAAFHYGDGVPYADAVTHHYSGARAVIAVSHENASLIHRLYRIPQDHIHVIYYGRPAQFFASPNPSTRRSLRQSLHLPDEAIACLTVARLAPVKGHEYLIEAIQQLRQTEVWEQLYFLWAGSGSGDRYSNLEPSLRATVRQLGLCDRVLFLGNRSDIADLLEASDLFVLPSKAEGMPLAIMEAMAKGVPVMASAVSGIPEELGDTGKLLSDPNVHPKATVADLVQTIHAWSADPDLRTSIGAACKQRAELLFQEERMLAQTVDVIEAVVLPSREDHPRHGMPPSTTPLSHHQIQTLENRIQYGSLVWQAWRQYHQGDLEKMAESLKLSVQFTPFSPTETRVNWAENFAKFSNEKGDTLNTYSLVTSKEWMEITHSLILQPVQ